MHVAVHLPDQKLNASFDSKEQAEAHVVASACSLCKCAGGDLLESPCAAEWLVIEEAALAKCKTVGDLFEAAGWAEVSDKLMKEEESCP
jgi:hypothetical protein